MKRRLHGAQAITAAARQLLEKGIELVVVSMGKQGACFVTAAETVIARPPDIEIRSTVGAGDAMVAGIVAAQLRRLPLEGCARLATAFSLQHLTRRGPRILTEPALEEAMRRVSIGKPAVLRCEIRSWSGDRSFAVKSEVDRAIGPSL